MSMPPGFAERLHREQEAQAAQTPYDPEMATKVVLHPKPEYQKTVVWDKNPWDVFERKVVLAYTGNRQRIDLLKTEFTRVGLDDVEVYWNCDDHFLYPLSTAIQASFNLKRTSILNNSLGHYRIIKTSYELGCTNCLVMEDDVRFLRDVSLLRASLMSMPVDYDVAMLDAIAPREEWPAEDNTGYCSEFRWKPVCTSRSSAACYALSRQGMEKMIALYEGDRLPVSDKVFNNRNFSKIYFASPCLARQVKIDSSATNTNYDRWSVQYDLFGAPRGYYGK